MIVKIMKAAASFAGVSYNEKKNDQGRSELLSAENMVLGVRNPQKSDYINYMEKVCSTNGRVKNKQFHAVVSCKGRENTPEELKEVAEQLLKKMGYGNNPYLIYFHSDTENNHVHLVSTRVGKDGVKVNDSFEEVRAQKALNEIMSVDLKQAANEAHNKALGYSFNNIAQYKMLMERMGWKVREKGDTISLYKSGEYHLVASKSEIEQIGKTNPVDDERKRQITALFHKYKEGLNHVEFQQFMRSKFGIDIAYHVGKGHVVPYGYSVIDNKSRSVFKGGEIMNLKELLATPQQVQKLDTCNKIVAAMFQSGENYTMEGFKAELNKYGYTFSMDGTITVKGEKEGLLRLDEKMLSKLQYNSRVGEANKYSVSSKREAEAMSRIFSVKPNDIPVSTNSSVDVSEYSDLMKSYTSNTQKDIGEEFSKRNISMVQDKGEVFLIDKNNKVVVSEATLGYKLESQRANVVTIHTNDVNRDIINSNPDLARGHNLIDILCDVLSGQNMNAHADVRRKKRGQQQN